MEPAARENKDSVLGEQQQQQLKAGLGRAGHWWCGVRVGRDNLAANRFPDSKIIRD